MRNLFIKYLICTFSAFFSFSMGAQNKEIELWPHEVQGSITSEEYKEKLTYKDSILHKAFNVTHPTLTVFYPKKANGTSIIICPGGGYQYLTMNKEGFKVATWLNSFGITAFVLKSRLPSDSIMQNKSIGPLQDAQRAVRYVRKNAEALGINEERIGVLGFSAGGHLAASVSTLYGKHVYNGLEAVSARPDFSILIYPVISMQRDIGHMGSRNNLLGTSPTNELIDQFSLQKQITDQTPPTFLVHATDDNSVPVENSIRYFMALKDNKVPVEMHVYENGGHGFGMGVVGTNKYWVEACEHWLTSLYD